MLLRSVAFASLLCWLVSTVPGGSEDAAGFVGAEVCSGCHVEETTRWRSSHHAEAMQPATSATVLGDFNGAELTHFGTVTRFFRAGEKFMVRTKGPGGAVQDHEIAYTFGVAPLQQYIDTAFPGGRYQAFGLAWDSRPKEHGGLALVSALPRSSLWKLGIACIGPVATKPGII